MEIKEVLNRFASLLLKYKWAICVLAVGIVLMLLPGGDKTEVITEPEIINTGPEISVEQQLSELLSKIQGAGKVEVMLSYASGAETIYHSDTENDSDSSKNSAVLVTGADRGESALVTRVDPPGYLGAIVICQGADSASVRLAIVEAVSKYTGLGADQIAVLKMK